jgi:hypothetical protein
MGKERVASTQARNNTLRCHEGLKYLLCGNVLTCGEKAESFALCEIYFLRRVLSPCFKPSSSACAANAKKLHSVSMENMLSQTEIKLAKEHKSLAFRAKIYNGRGK